MVKQGPGPTPAPGAYAGARDGGGRQPGDRGSVHGKPVAAHCTAQQGSGQGKTESGGDKAWNPEGRLAPVPTMPQEDLREADVGTREERGAVA